MSAESSANCFDWDVSYMEIKIAKEMDNPFFKRKDLQVEIVHAGAPTPRTDDLKKELAKIYKVDETQVSVDYILTKRGIGESTARVKILNEKPTVVEKPKEVPKEAPTKAPEEIPKEEKKIEEPKENSEREDKKEGDKTEAQTSESQ
jgi:ribosomal protein S24E